MPLLRAWSHNILISVLYSLRAGIVSHPGTREFLWVLLTWHQEGGLVLNIGVMNTFHLIHSLILPEKCINHLDVGCCQYSHNSLWPLLSSLHNFSPLDATITQVFSLGPHTSSYLNFPQMPQIQQVWTGMVSSSSPHPLPPNPTQSGLLPEFLVWADPWLVL